MTSNTPLDTSPLFPLGGIANRFRAKISAADSNIKEANHIVGQPPEVSGSWNTGYSYPDDWHNEATLLDRLQFLTVLRSSLTDACQAGTELQHALQFVQPSGDTRAWLDGRNWVTKQIDEVNSLLDDIRLEVTAVQEATWRVRRNNLGLGEAWVGGWSLGSGTFGEATGWYKRNDQDVIIDRVVVKQTHDNAYGAGTRDLKYTWSKDPRDPSGNTILPNELAALYSLRNQAGSETVVEIRNHRLMKKDKSVRIYLEYCPYGDFEQYACWYYRTTKSNQTEADWEDFHEAREYVIHDHLPEPFLWSVFESLAVSGRLMEQAENPIYHLDYKTQNVLLGIESNNHYRRYPMAKLTDFGLSWIPDRAEGRVPSEQRFGGGTVFNAAPEQIPVHYDGDRDFHLIDAKTNVWGVGIVMWSLIEHEEGDHRLSWEHRNEASSEQSPGRAFPQDNDPDIMDTPDFRAAAYQHYSRPLLDLIVRAVSYEQADRPTFQELLDTIRKHTQGHPGIIDRANGMRRRRADAPEWDQSRNSMDRFLKQDKYRLFAKLPELPVPARLDDEAWRTPPTRHHLVGADDGGTVVGGGPGRGIRRPRGR